MTSAPAALPPDQPLRPSRLLILGWLLAAPGLWAIASFLLFDSVSRWAGCPAPLGLNFPACPASVPGRLADLLRQTVALTAVGTFIGIGAIPPLYAGLFVSIRLARRLGLWWIGAAAGGGASASRVPACSSALR